MTAPDPMTVRKIAREAMRRGGSDSSYGSIGSVISEHAAMDEVLASGDRAAFGRLHAAVRTELKGATITVSWPDEQQPADVVTAEQQQDGAVGRVEAWLDNRVHSTFYGPVAPETICSYPVDGDGCSVVYVLTESDLRAVLAERTALAARVAELRGERDTARAEVARAWEDLTTVREERGALTTRVAELESERDEDLCVLAAFLLPNRRPIEEWLCILANRFEARANALMRDADRFAAARFRVDRVPTATETEES